MAPARKTNADKMKIENVDGGVKLRLDLDTIRCGWQRTNGYYHCGRSSAVMICDMQKPDLAGGCMDVILPNHFGGIHVAG